MHKPPRCPVLAAECFFPCWNKKHMVACVKWAVAQGKASCFTPRTSAGVLSSSVSNVTWVAWSTSVGPARTHTNCISHILFSGLKLATWERAPTSFRMHASVRRAVVMEANWSGDGGMQLGPLGLPEHSHQLRHSHVLLCRNGRDCRDTELLVGNFFGCPAFCLGEDQVSVRDGESATQQPEKRDTHSKQSSQRWCATPETHPSCWTLPRVAAKFHEASRFHLGGTHGAEALVQVLQVLFRAKSAVAGDPLVGR